MKSMVSKQEEGVTLYQQALCLVLEHRLASVGLIQRHLRLGHSKAIQVMDAMARVGVVGAHIENDGYRRILWTDAQRIRYLLSVKRIGSPGDPDRIPIVLDTLRLVWEQMPSLRLGQLVANIVKPAEVCPELFYIEDAHLIELSRAFLER